MAPNSLKALSCRPKFLKSYYRDLEDGKVSPFLKTFIWKCFFLSERWRFWRYFEHLNLPMIFECRKKMFIFWILKIYFWLNAEKILFLILTKCHLFGPKCHQMTPRWHFFMEKCTLFKIILTENLIFWPKRWRFWRYFEHLSLPMIFEKKFLNF